MRPLAVGAVLVIVLLLVLAWEMTREHTRRGWAEAEQTARWEDGHTTLDGVTCVVVRRIASHAGEQRVLGEVVVDRIPEGDPQWSERFAAARQAAYDRVIDLNSGRSLG